MASDKHKLTLMSVPLEVRHHIFKYVAARDAPPKKLLRYWFEKKEVKQKMAELVAKNVNAVPQVVYAGDQFNDDESEESNSDYDDGSEEEDDEDGDEDGDEEGDEEDEEEDTEMNEATDATNAPASSTTGAGTAQVVAAAAALNSQPAGQLNAATAAQNTAPAGAGQAWGGASQGLAAALLAANNALQASIATVAAMAPTLALGPLQGQAEDEDEDEDLDLDADMGEDGEEEDPEMDEDGENEDGNDGADTDSDDEMASEGEGANTGAGAARPPRRAPIVTAHRKWRHIPQFMRITHCPPPAELFLTSQQLNAEAKSWFYDVAVLRIDATGSFAHTSFFEEAFSQITEAAFSPMENIHKVEITFVWDATWLRSEQADYAAAIFPALLRQRAYFVTNILAQAPSLSEVTIRWHDSAQDEEAVDLMNDVLIGFLSLKADVKVETHYIAADAKPYKRSIAGKQRVEFQRIVDNGLDRLF